MNLGSQNTFRALADPTRRQILQHLSASEMSIGEIVDQFDMTRAAIKKHLVILEEGRLISVQHRGRERINCFEPQGLESVSDWLNFFNGFWDERLNKLKHVIENESGNND